ncbi:hypothetical protein [Zoogloea sp.]|uniref:hypothetical protein n=1 Tax=Zoogloea sp. TaxID=49181 RepID=UPI0026251D2F|nr:hypothetical protein [Zoogloea sp.]MDD3353587.1 hypothetical protein [Zoogloea sp.]
MKPLLLCLAVLITGCAGMLPTANQDVSNRWKAFDDAKAAFDRILPYETTMETVRELGFDPASTPNVQILNHSQVVRMVLPSPLQERAAIPPGLLDCMKAQDGCTGYFMEPSRINRERVGNFMLDFLNFKRDTRTTGWKFGALIVVVGEKVVFKQWSGRPRIEETELRRNPLGPLQGVGESLRPGP